MQSNTRSDGSGPGGASGVSGVSGGPRRMRRRAAAGLLPIALGMAATGCSGSSGDGTDADRSVRGSVEARPHRQGPTGARQAIGIAELTELLAERDLPGCRRLR